MYMSADPKKDPLSHFYFHDSISLDVLSWSNINKNIQEGAPLHDPTRALNHWNRKLLRPEIKVR